MNVIFSPTTIPSFNLAAEEHLFKKQGQDFLFLYVNDPSVIVGSNQVVMNEVDIDFCIENDITIIRRLSGGGAVYHDRGNFNYSFIHNKTDAPLSAKFLQPIVETLHTMDIPVNIGKRKDIWLNEKKISGTASHVSKGRELHHGTLLYNSDLEILQKALTSKQKDYTRKGTPSVPSPVINIHNYLVAEKGVAYETDQFFLLLTNNLLKYFKASELSTFNEIERESVEIIRKSKYIQRDWNYRM